MSSCSRRYDGRKKKVNVINLYEVFGRDTFLVSYRASSRPYHVLPAILAQSTIHINTKYMCIFVTGVDAMESDTVRTNIVMDSKLVEAGLKATGLKTRRELVDFALRELLRHKQQKKLLSLKGKVAWEGDLAEMRTGRGQ